MNLGAIILAGGESTRMGRDKAWLELDGTSLLQRAVDNVRALGIAEVFISGRAGADYAAVQCPVLVDREPRSGPLSGIERGLHACTSPLLLVLAVDLPRMTAAFLQQLAANCTPSTGVVPVRHGAMEPLAAIYPKRCHALAAEALAGSRPAARDFAAACYREHAVRLLPVTTADAAAFANWNTPGDIGC